MEKEIICGCCHKKLLAKQRKDGKIYVWCKECRKEVELEIEIEQPKTKCWLCGGTGKLPTGFYGIGSCSNADIIADRFPEPCHICKGKGYI